QPPGGAGISRGDRVRTRDAVGRAEGATQDVVAPYDRSQLSNLRRLDPACVRDSKPQPHRQKPLEVVDLVAISDQEQIADLPELRIDARLRFEACQQLNRQLLHEDV